MELTETWPVKRSGIAPDVAPPPYPLPDRSASYLGATTNRLSDPPNVRTNRFIIPHKNTSGGGGGGAAVDG